MAIEYSTIALTHGVQLPGASSPAIINGVAILDTYPGVTKGALADATARSNNGAAIQACVDYCALNGLYIYAPPGRYEYTISGIQNSRNVGLRIPKEVPGFFGAGPQLENGTVLVQYAVNHPVITLGDVSTTASAMHQGATFGNFCVAHGVSQTGQTSADGVLFGRAAYSKYLPIESNRFASGGTFDPYVAFRFGLSNSQFLFSCDFDVLHAQGAQQHMFRWDANTTGNVFTEIHLGSGGFGDRRALAAAAFHVNTANDFGTIGQLNVEWVDQTGQHLIRFDNSKNVRINTIHLEGNKLNGFDPALVHATSGNVQIGALRALDTWIASGTVTGSARFLSAYDSSRISVDHMYMEWNGSGYNAEAVATAAMKLYDDDGSIVGRKPLVCVRNFNITGHTGTFACDDNLSDPLTHIGEYRFNKTRSETLDATLTMGNANLTVYGRHRRCTVKADTTLTAARTLTLSDKLVSGGTSVRQAGDIVEVHRTAGGAFDLIIANQSGATIGTLAAAGALTFEWNGSAWV